MPWSKHYDDVAEPRRKDTDGGDSLLSLSLGDIYSNNAGGGFRSPAVTPMMRAPVRSADALRAPSAAVTAKADASGFRPPAVTPASVRTADVLRAPSAAVAAVHPPPRIDALVVEAKGAFFFPAASGAPTLPQMASSDGRRVAVPAPVVRGDVTAAAPTKRPAKRSRSVHCRSRAKTNLLPAASNGDDETVEGGLHICPPYRWSTERVGVHHSLAELSKRGIDTVTGELHCKRCDHLRLLTLDIEAKFKDLCSYISCNIHGMDDRAPQRWKEPALPDCDECGQKNSMRPVIPADKHKINWVFLLLSEMLGVCTLEQLKHFCERTQQHRTGAKDRVLYSTYMELCNQLLPNGPFDMESVRRKRIRPNA
ncbi:hypothetical protein SETIT_3G159100v2 [Setaria italica]|uniref:DUF7086 domain-containing protein n=1 Tax=Setaria italica TaxID=4555 RepID=A0A368QFF5_SETIT|nr:hypothetical protein SETIT_3G159100v2 [Setaria italica]